MSKHFSSQCDPLKKYGNVFTLGNSKLDKSTIIFNLTPAPQCISKKLGLCQLQNTNKYYALKAEKQYKNTANFRLRQKQYWINCSVHQFIKDIGAIVKKSKHVIKYLRFNESGDIRHKDDILKIDFIAKWVKAEYGITTYLYTTRRDLLPILLKCQNVIINGYGFMVHNNYTVVSPGTTVNSRFNIDSICDCSKICGLTCHKCIQNKYKTIGVLLH